MDQKDKDKNQEQNNQGGQPPKRLPADPDLSDYVKKTDDPSGIVKR